jgi:hypothetical protein
MNADLLVDIQNTVEYKFKNHIYPDLVNIIKDYLYVNPDKFDIYKKTKVTPTLLLENLSLKEELISGNVNVNHKLIIKYIKEIIEEGKICYI